MDRSLRSAESKAKRPDDALAKLPKPVRGIRMSPDARRRQILTVASTLLTAGGIEAVQITEVADYAGVTRPIVYRFFQTREALVLAVLEDFASALDESYRGALVRSIGQPIDTIIREFIAASCDTIEAKGAGAWRLLDARGISATTGVAGLAIHDRLFSPWFRQLEAMTGVPESEMSMIISAVVAAGRSTLDHWIDRRVDREVASANAARAVRAIVVEFARNRS